MPWELAYGLGTAVLGLALAYGIYQSRTRNKANDKVTDEATRELYKDPDAYQHGGREQLKQELEPD